jgi:hyperosmotically inducible periplasmic protein
VIRVRILLLGAVLLAVGCATIDPREDLRIEAEVKARLVAEKDANLTRIDVTSTRGTVYLSGTVESSESRGQAAVLASQVRGVTRVVNKLEVRRASSGRVP